MLVEYQNKTYQRKGRLRLSFCEEKCPLHYFNSDPCYIGKMPYICLVLGDVTLSDSDIFNL